MGVRLRDIGVTGAVSLIDQLEAGLQAVQTASCPVDREPEFYDSVTSGSGAAAAAMLLHQRCRRHGPFGIVVLDEFESKSRSFPVGDAGLTHSDWIGGLGLSLLARDHDALITLCTPDSIAACAPVKPDPSPRWLLYCAALAAIVVDVASTSGLAAECRVALRRVDADRTTETMATTLDLLQLLATSDGGGFSERLGEALLAWESRSELPVEVVALAALAFDRGVKTAADSDRLPQSLVRGEFQRRPTRVTLRYPTRAISTQREAHWFLDLEGFPSENRSHQVLDDGTQLVARYEAWGAPGVPHAVIDLIDGIADEGAPPPLLDAGELVLLAESFADDRALFDAISCIDLALTRIPSDHEQITPGDITSPRSRMVFDAEPGRFEREHLVAYRDILKRQAAEGLGPDDALETLRAEALPLLRAIPHLDEAELRATLQPAVDDYAKVFVGSAVEVARAAYEAMFADGLAMSYPAADQTEIEIHPAPAGLLADDNGLSRNFPEGYRAIADALNPHLVWLAWRYTKPGETAGISFDGLVWVQDHWAWFPKPYRVLRERKI